MKSFEKNINIAIFGSHGGIGEALVNSLKQEDKVKKIYSFSRTVTAFNHPKISENNINIENEDSIKAASKNIPEGERLDIIIIATGILHDEKNGLSPEKSIRDMDIDNFVKSYSVNAVGPAIIAKYFIPLLNRDGKTVFSALSARVSSISDNHLGGWYAYRASKTALNQIIKTLSVEIGRKYKNACVVGLHPGTVDSDLSKPFKANVDPAKLFSPEKAANHLIDVIDKVKPEDGGKLFAWDGEVIPY